MNNYYPGETPEDILAKAQEDWLEGSHGKIELIQQHITVIHAKQREGDRQTALFWIIREPGETYPVMIVGKGEESFVNTPGELRAKMMEIFNSSAVKSEIFNLCLPIDQP
jgi:hypothetical protein